MREPTRTLIFSLWLFAAGNLSATDTGYPPLQPIIDAAEPGVPLILDPGTYAGPVVIEDPITIDGQNRVTIDGGGKGTVIFVDADNVKLRNLRIINSGEQHNKSDAAIRVSGRFNVIQDNLIEDSLFGILLHQADFNVIRRNRISSLDRPTAQRGDGIRIWYSFDNRIVDNHVVAARDVIVLDSGGAYISGNTVMDGRYSLSIISSSGCVVENNRFLNNESGIFTLKVDSIEIRNNTIAYTTSLGTGVGIGLKDSSNARVENNRIHHVSVGMALDISPEQPEQYNSFYGNLLANNAIGVRFLSDWSGNRFTGNRFYNNHTQVVVRGGGDALRNLWKGNYWDDYQGFDRDDDGIGDKPYKLYAYADQLWIDKPMARFFLATPMLSVMDFLARLAPFNQPVLLIQDDIPSVNDSPDYNLQQP